MVIITATLLPLTEIGLGLMLILKLQQQTALRITVLLFLVFFLFAVYGTAIGINEDCGCFGSVLRSEFGITMILRNILLTASALWLVFENKKFASAGQKTKQ